MAVDILIVGEAPSRNPERARSKVKMAHLLRVSPAALAYGIPVSSGGIAWLNLFEKPQTRNANGSAFDAELAKDAAEDLRAVLEQLPAPSRPKVILLLGKRVGEAWIQGTKTIEFDYFQKLNLGVDAKRWALGVESIPTYCVPHPSGVNRWWNERGNETKAFIFFRRMRKQFFPDLPPKIPKPRGGARRPAGPFKHPFFRKVKP